MFLKENSLFQIFLFSSQSSFSIQAENSGIKKNYCLEWYLLNSEEKDIESRGIRRNKLGKINNVEKAIHLKSKTDK